MFYLQDDDEKRFPDCQIRFPKISSLLSSSFKTMLPISGKKNGEEQTARISEFVGTTTILKNVR
jgi:hypothetical protein